MLAAEDAFLNVIASINALKPDISGGVDPLTCDGPPAVELRVWHEIISAAVQRLNAEVVILQNLTARYLRLATCLSIA